MGKGIGDGGGGGGGGGDGGGGGGTRRDRRGRIYDNYVRVKRRKKKVEREKDTVNEEEMK